MCGIGGIVARQEDAPFDPVLQAMADAMAHRGPDGSGTYRHGPVGFVHTRLAIIDLQTGDQPLHLKTDKGDDLTLVANGEIYNYIELRRQLGENKFATRSDCEPILHLYARHGTGFADHLRGMYALALHDKQTGRVVLSRDPFGIKPLYYTETADGIAFASEVGALIAAGFASPAVDQARAVELLQLQFTTGFETIYPGVQRVLPGETIVFDGARVVERRYRRALPETPVSDTSAKHALGDLDRLLNDAVGIHQRSDVPYGMFLSGGIDSSVLMAMMHRLNPAPVRAYTVGFPGTSAHDERDHARAVAQAAGADHVEVAFSETDFWTLLPRVAKALDDPAADYATLPTFKLAQRARADGIKVVLTGEGGDELFGGYGRYRRALRPRLFGGRAMRAKGAFDGLGILKTTGTAWRAGMAEAETQAQARHRPWTKLQQLQAVDCADWLPNDLLTKADRCLMANGVEGRVPLLDSDLAAFAFALPDRHKIRKSLGKWLLRKWLESGLPVARPFARKKGFTVPVGEWIAARGRDVGPLVAAQPGIQALADGDAVRALFADGAAKHGQAAWALLFYAVWHQVHILGGAVGTDALDTLSAP